MIPQFFVLRKGVHAGVHGFFVYPSSCTVHVTLVSIFGNKLLPAEVFESYGTIRFINEFPLMILAMLTGGTLIMDEFDASIGKVIRYTLDELRFA